MAQKKALVLITDGTEEMEATIAVDVLRRAQLSVTVAGVALKNPNYADCSRGLKIIPDILLEQEPASWDENDLDVIVIPGGAQGAKTLASNARVLKLLSSQNKQGKLVGFICAGSLAAKQASIGLGGKITSHPSVRAELEQYYEYSEDRVVVAGNVITSRGPGTSFAFALAIVEQLLGKEVSQSIAEPMILPPVW